MWNNVLMTDSYSRSIIKSALKSGHISLAVPDDDYEYQQVKEITNSVNRSKLVDSSLLYSLLFDSVILDSGTFGNGSIIKNTDDIENIEQKELFTNISEGFSSLFKVTDPVGNSYGYTNDKKNHKVNLISSPEERVELYQLLEPYVWNRVSRLGKERITRQVMNDIFLVLRGEPEILSDVRERDLQSDLDYIFFANRFENFWSKFDKNKNNIKYFHHTIYTLDTMASVAIAKVQEAQRLKAALPIKNISNYTGSQTPLTDLQAESGDFLVSARLVLKEFQYFPELKNIDDVLKLKDDKGFTEFREFINRWVCSISVGDKENEQKLRKEIEKSNLSIAKAHKCQNIGRYVTYLGVPTAILELFVGTPLGITLTVGGAIAQKYSEKVLAQERWLLIGQQK